MRSSLAYFTAATLALGALAMTGGCKSNKKSDTPKPVYDATGHNTVGGYGNYGGIGAGSGTDSSGKPTGDTSGR